MINLYNLDKNNNIICKTHDIRENLVEAPLWIDLLNITPDEEAFIENYLGIDIPTREEIQQIEISRRLYQEKEALYMTAVIVSNSDTPSPESHSATFILYKNYLITIRYENLRVFKTFGSHITKNNRITHIKSAEEVFVSLIEAVIGRVADILERTRKNLDDAASAIFPDNDKIDNTKVNHKESTDKIGRNGRLISKTRESLVTLDRLVIYSTQDVNIKLKKNTISRLKSILQDIKSLTDYANFLSSETTFLLDATLGMVNIEQNKIIKILSVMASIFMPPTLIASIYGMNFEFMPELKWKYGYLYAVGLASVAVLIPYKYFKKRGWF